QRPTPPRRRPGASVSGGLDLSRHRPIPWAGLLWRTFAADVLHCCTAAAPGASLRRPPLLHRPEHPRASEASLHSAPPRPSLSPLFGGPARGPAASNATTPSTATACANLFARRLDLSAAKGHEGALFGNGGPYEPAACRLRCALRCRHL